MVGRKLWINSAYFSEKAKNKRIGSTQTATWRAVISERVMTARLFFTLSAVKGVAELHNKSPPDVLHFKKNHEMEDVFMSEWRKIRIQEEYTYVIPEVYEILANTFRKEAHAEQMRDLRNRTAEGYTEGDTEDLLMESPESLEDMVIRQMEIETLQKAMQTLSEIQRERLHLYFFEGMTTREIADRQGTNQNAVWKSIQSGVAVLRRFF